MKKIYKGMNLQMFAAPTGLTGADNIQVRAHEIDFVTSFGKNIQALLDILGIIRPIRKANGSVLKTKKVTGTLQDGKVAECESIPLSEYKVEEEVFDTIRIEKFRKAVSIEAIAEKGYEAAVSDTDEQFRIDLQDNITDRLYKQLNSGSLVGHEATWQMAIAMAIGNVKHKFQKMKRNTTGTVVFVNTLDAYRYLGEANVSMQTAFGLTYIKNFLGADIVFLTDRVAEKTVVATPMNNIIAYYVDPSDSEFVKAGLSYTTDSTTGFLGFHVEGNYDRAISDMFAIMGLRLMCEYQDAIAHFAVGDADTQTLRDLTLTASQGEETGTTKVAVAEQLQSMNNKFKYKVGASEETVAYGADVKSCKNFEEGADIKAAETNHCTVVECDKNYKAVSKGDVVVDLKA